MNFKELQERIYRNKVNHGFNVKDVFMEFCSAFNELGEASDAFAYKDRDDVGTELADTIIYILGIVEILNREYGLGIDLEDRIMRKIEKIEKRVYTKQENGGYTKTEG